MSVRDESIEHAIKACDLLRVRFQDEAVFSCDARHSVISGIACASSMVF